MRWSPVLLIAICACTGVSEREEKPANDAHREPKVQEVFAYRACDFAVPGELIALPREVPVDVDPIAAAVSELLRGVTEEERARGCRSFFSSETDGSLRGVRSNPDGDTVHLDFHDFSAEVPDEPTAKSFLPPGVMAELTWTIFHQFPGVEAVRFSFDGDEQAFWDWLGGESTEPTTFTRGMWERI
jgi:hypothetical protein